VSSASISTPNSFERVPVKFGYNPGLDGLRALAVAGVIAAHGQYQASGGYHGVTVFFVISGYLITSLLMAEFENTGKINFLHFYWRRFVRLGPALIVVVAVTVLFLLIIGVPIATWWTGVLFSLTSTTDLFAAFSNGAPFSEYFTYTWSLGIEEQFYLFWPLLLLVFLRWGKFIPTLVALVLGIVGVWLFRFYLTSHDAPASVVNFGPLTHVDALFLGCGIAIVITRYPNSALLRRISDIVGPLGVLALIVLLFHPHIGGVVNEYGATALAAAAIVAWVAFVPERWFSRALGFWPLAFLGRLSYSMYLWNIVLLGAFQHYFFGLAPSSYRAGPFWIASVLLMAYLSYTFIEQPLRKKLAPPQAHAILGAQAGPASVTDPVVKDAQGV
jgi:peptidoglycan/LPS O-acetylase OafA/YrhL